VLGFDVVRRFRAAVLASIALALGCASDRAGRTKLADGSYEIACRKPLGDCLAEFADVCRDHGYDVLRGKEEKERFGVEPVNTEVVTSKATIRCRSAKALIGEERPEAAPLAAPAQGHAAAARCFPGSTQACLGPGACKGAQTCRSDGAGYGVCDCGSTASGRQAPASPEGSDAGPPPTWAVPATDGPAPQ
jgi:hypothetical protein